MARVRYPDRFHPAVARRFTPQIALFLFALATRLPLMSRSLDEVDVANFVNGLTNGFNIPALRPHPPGFPVYMLAGATIDGIVGDPLLSLTILSAVSGSLAVLPFFSIVRSLAGRGWAVWASLFLLLNPLYWAFCESALSDIPSAALTVALAYSSMRGLKSRRHFYLSAAIASSAIGIRLGNVALLGLPGLTIVHMLLRDRPGALAAIDMWARIFAAVTGLWIVYMVYWGSQGTADYLAAFQKQWATAVTIYDIRSVADPQILNALVRIERFFVGYFFTYPWLGLDERSRFGTWLSLPWVLGFCLFVAAFRARDFRHQLVAIWVLSFVYTAITIHFLPRYGLPHLPGYVAGTVIGFRFLTSELPRRRRAPEALLLIALAVTLLLFSVKSQAPIATFEMTPPDGSRAGALLFALGIVSLMAARYLLRPSPPGPLGAPGLETTLPLTRWKVLGIGSAAAVAILLGVVGFRRVGVVHASISPAQQLVEYVRDNFDRDRIVVCWDPVTHSSFELLLPGLVPVGYQSLDELRSSIVGTKTLVATDACIRYDAVLQVTDLKLVRTFEGNSPAWSKSPVLRLYSSADPGSSGAGH